MFALVKETCVRAQVSVLLHIINEMDRNVAFMFYHEIIKIYDFVQGLILTIKIK